MPLRTLLYRASCFAVIVSLLGCHLCRGQSLKPIPAPSTTSPVQESAEENNLPFKMTSRFHLQKGTNQGYVVLKVELEKEHYLYSLTQVGDIRPTRITATPSKLIRLTAKFNPDRPATIIEKDPVFKQRIEKHKNVIQFFAPIEVASNTEVRQLTAELVVNGQVCKEAGFCIPIINQKVKSRFAGYFDRNAQKRENSQSSTDSGTVRR